MALALALTPPLGGHSYGVWIAAHYAARYPKRIAGLVLLDPARVFAGFHPGYVLRALPVLVRPHSTTDPFLPRLGDRRSHPRRGLAPAPRKRAQPSQPSARSLDRGRTRPPCGNRRFTCCSQGGPAATTPAASPRPSPKYSRKRRPKS
ncbi:alpha/beta fold hydrolase [Streptomyces sp. NPDC087219]|uniref:alpha/beta fold hydrolase n=1 Tax=Streptomyces sp. NPDC087219 TaxID=3365770 RepID=UPI00381CF2E8